MFSKKSVSAGGVPQVALCMAIGIILGAEDGLEHKRETWREERRAGD